MVDNLKKLPLAPFLFAILSFTVVYKSNMDEIGLGSIPKPLLMILVAITTLLAITYAVTKSIVRSSIITLMITIAFFTYGHVYILMRELLPFTEVHGFMKLMMTGFLICFFLLCTSVYRTKMDLKKSNSLISLLIGILLIYNLASIIYEKTLMRDAHPFELATTEPSDIKPDIYYLIFDSYPGQETLSRFFSFDLSPFINELESMGFYMAGKSRCNYFFTDLSLASSLNMDHLVKMSEKYGERYLSYGVLDDLIDNSAVHRTLRSKGYSLIQYNSGWSVTSKNELADRIKTFGKIPYNITDHLMYTTLLRIFSRGYLKRKLEFKAQSIPAIFSDIKSSAGSNHPKFVFAHIFSPHPPNIFKPAGNTVTDLLHRHDIMYNKDWFLDEIRYLNPEILMTAKKIIYNSKVRPVIIFQADHGSRFQTREDLKIKESAYIFNAYYVPERCKDQLYPAISPVNSFRVIFNCLFNTNYRMLPDDLYLSEMRAPHNFRRITKDALEY